MTDNQNTPEAPVPLYALVRGDYAIMVSSDKEHLRTQSLPTDRIYAYETPLPAEDETRLPYPSFNDVDHSLGLVTLVHPHTQMSPRQKKFFNQIKRVSAYPLIGDQIGAIVNQIRSMDVPLTPEFEGICGRIDQVKKDNPYE